MELKKAVRKADKSEVQYYIIDEDTPKEIYKDIFGAEVGSYIVIYDDDSAFVFNDVHFRNLFDTEYVKTEKEKFGHAMTKAFGFFGYDFNAMSKDRYIEPFFQNCIFPLAMKIYEIESLGIMWDSK